MIKVGIVGIGFMGMIHSLAYKRLKGVKVAAIVSRDERKLAGDWRGIQGNFGPPGGMTDLSRVSRYRELDELLADPAIDLVDICLPPALHAEAAIAALRAGKHVLCEKPIAVSLADGQRMEAAAKKSGRQLLIAHVLPFFPEYAFARQLAESGKYGRLLGGHFKRVISEPTWLPDFFDPEKVGGPLIDLHIHDAHFIRLLFGQPKAVVSRGPLRNGVVELASSQFLFEDKSLAVSALGGVIRQQGRAFTHAYEIFFERATVTFDFSVADGKPRVAAPVTVFGSRGKTLHPELPGGDPLDAFAAELGEACKSVRAGRASDVLAGELALDALRLCHKQAASVKSGRPVAV